MPTRAVSVPFALNKESPLPVLRWCAVACPAASAQLLRIAGGRPVLRIEQTTFSREGRAFEHLQSTFRDMEGRRVFFNGGGEDA